MIDLIRRAQARLKALGYALGTSGPVRDGVDGDPGLRTWTAIVEVLDRACPAPATPPPCALPPAVEMVTPALLRVVVPDRDEANLEAWSAAIRAACVRFEINTIRRVAAFIAQMAHESGLKCLDENLRYSSAERIKTVFGQGEAGRRRFPTIFSAQPYVGQPEKLANYVYANRMGNGPPESGDGWRFRGGGPLQNTGRDNWTRFAEAMGMCLDEALAFGRTLEGGIMAAAWFWEENDINRLADTPGVADESRAINGGKNGLADRTAKFNALVAAMLRLERKEAL